MWRPKPKRSFLKEKEEAMNKNSITSSDCLKATFDMGKDTKKKKGGNQMKMILEFLILIGFFVWTPFVMEILFTLSKSIYQFIKKLLRHDRYK